jgi:hypothetical protein
MDSVRNQTRSSGDADGRKEPNNGVVVEAVGWGSENKAEVEQ